MNIPSYYFRQKYDDSVLICDTTYKNVKVFVLYRRMIHNSINFAVSPSGKPPHTGFQPTCALG